MRTKGLNFHGSASSEIDWTTSVGKEQACFKKTYSITSFSPFAALEIPTIPLIKLLISNQVGLCAVTKEYKVCAELTLLSED